MIITTYVTDEKYDTTQFFLNLPFGETMAEQMIGVYDNPYKFNAKELDNEIGLYYYGARYYNPRLSIWYGVDPLAEKYPSLSPYIYVANNPINVIDPDGRVIIFINGQHGGDGGNRKYWNGLDQRIADRFRDYQGYYYDGSSYSHEMGMKTISHRWGASPKYLNKIPHPMMQKFNQYLRRQKLPFGDNLQRADPGHYHIDPNF